MAEFDPGKALTVDVATGEILKRVAERLGVSETDAIRQAVERLDSDLARRPESAKTDKRPLREKLAEWRRDNPLPPPTGLKADKAFFDEMWDEV